MNPLMLVRPILGFCASSVVTSSAFAILRTTTVSSNKFLKVVHWIGAFAVAITAGFSAQKAVEKCYDETLEIYASRS